MAETDQTQEYVLQRDKFKKKKAGWLEQVAQHESEIAEIKRQIEEARPKTKNGLMVCNGCDCVSMKYVGRTPKGGCSGGDDIYECEICGRDNLSPHC